ncbi:MULTISPECIES: DUF5028 domain-containing protein [Caproicibacterium]|uniref:DUF5028 domain-containing protein n=1 Tax=Caproicibacterium argilliputei TaxID=3030016 RepID=A0AA97DD75_9FIRM|nr:DUF5028 domain-containing protein [Caproicibacterium argilliputei]WOC33370.1 DUF5028 domain-containing protein [Caproicibacterium argilliputei]
MKKRVFAVLAVMLALFACAGRIAYVNGTAEKAPKTSYYVKGEELSIGKNIFDKYIDGEQADGYYVILTNAKLVPIEEFLQEYKLTKEKAMPKALRAEKENTMPAVDYIYEVKIHVTNKTNALVGKAGINLMRWDLLATDFSVQIQQELYTCLNPFAKGSLTFSVKKGASRDFILPYGICSSVISPEKLKQRNPSVIISEYPVRKMIKLV